jgi:hypothetical protein
MSSRGVWGINSVNMKKKGRNMRVKEKIVTNSVVHPDPEPAGSGIICKLGSESVINSGSDSGFESGSKLSFVSNQKIQSCKNVQIKKQISFFAMFR